MLATVSIAAIASSSFAAKKEGKSVPVVSDLKVKLSGYADAEMGFRNQSKLQGTEKNVSANRKHFALFSSSAIAAEVSNKAEDIEYGAKMVLVPTTKRKASPSYNGSHIFVESDFGKFQAGSPIVPGATMSISGDDVTAAPSTRWSRYTEFKTAHLTQGSKLTPSFATSDEQFMDGDLATNEKITSYSSEPARSVAYYTPKFELGKTTKVQLGVAYIPDSSNTGAGSLSTQSNGIDSIDLNTTDSTTVSKFEIDRSVKNAFSGGVAIEHNFADGVDLKIAITGECGKAAGSVKQYNVGNTGDNAVPNATYKLSDLKAYNAGAVLNIGNFAFAGSAGTYGKSLTSAEFHKTGRKTDYYTAAAAYNQGPFTASVGMFKSNQFKNKVDSISFATSYQLAPGFKPYASISGFMVKGKPEYRTDLDKKKSRGTVALIGAKLSL